MKTYADKTQNNNYQTPAYSGVFRQRTFIPSVYIVDNRSEALAQTELQAIANTSPQVLQLQAYQAMANNRHVTQTKENKTGDPDNRKTGIENFSDSFLAIAGSLKNLPVQRTVETWGGTWDTPTYKEFEENVGTDKEVHGVDIILEFAPNENVNADKIGLTQSVRSLKTGDINYITKNKEAKERKIEESRMVREGANYGTSIDRFPQSLQNNPIYGVSNEPDETENDLSATRTDSLSEEKNELGKRVNDDVKKAKLSDTPALNIKKPFPENTGQEFETTALAISGDQQGTYYGSVKWGWKIDQGKFRKIELVLAGKKEPSDNFFEAAKQWNEGFANVNFMKELVVPNIKLPIPEKEKDQPPE